MGSNDSTTASNLLPFDIFQDACKSNNLENLSHLIRENKFNVNSRTIGSGGNYPLVFAIIVQSNSVVTLLLDCGADPNAGEGEPLRWAIWMNNLGLVQLLLDRGANPNPPEGILQKAIVAEQLDIMRLLLDRGANLMAQYIDVVHQAILHATPHHLEAIELLIEYFGQYAEDQNSYEAARKCIKYLQLCHAVLKQDQTSVTQILKCGDYEDYMDIFASYNKKYNIRPVLLTFRFDNLNMIRVFARENVDLDYIYWEAVRQGDLKMLEICASSPSFDPHIRDSEGATALHLACLTKRFDVVMILIKKFGLKLSMQDYDGQTPLFSVYDPRMMRKLLETFPRIQLNSLTDRGTNLLGHMSFQCDVYSVLLENGANPRLSIPGDHHKCRNKLFCAVIRHMQKLLLIDSNYVNKILRNVLNIDWDTLSSFKIIKREEYESELAIMKSLRISYSNSFRSGKNLFDFMFLKVDEAVRFSMNDIILEIYHEHNCDFRNYLPQYGFALNFMLRKGTIRREFMDSGDQLLSSTLGAELPGDMAQMVLNHLTNSELERFTLGSATE